MPRAADLTYACQASRYFLIMLVASIKKDHSLLSFAWATYSYAIAFPDLSSRMFAAPWSMFHNIWIVIGHRNKICLLCRKNIWLLKKNLVFNSDSVGSLGLFTSYFLIYFRLGLKYTIQTIFFKVTLIIYITAIFSNVSNTSGKFLN